MTSNRRAKRVDAAKPPKPEPKGAGRSAERIHRLFDIFQEAVEAERSARRRYEEAASLCEDGQLKAILLEFAEDELKHEREILLRFQQIARTMQKEVH
jgi:rubrerythrin